MDKTGKARVGLIGLGNIGRHHADYLQDMENVELAGVCDVDRKKAEQFAAKLQTQAYFDHPSMIAEAGLDAVIIAVPHYDHPAIAEAAFRQGIHVLCEKPLAVHVNDARKMIGAYEEAKHANPDLVFGIMFQERTLPHYRKIKEIVASGDLGRLMRTTWINTTWFRSQAYYDSGGWRATWAGEGGGILTNQCPHNLDFYQWTFGLPKRITGHAHIGKYHQIEVEDEVTAYFEHENGMIGHFIVTTAESPGSNRLEIAGENGKLVYESGKIMLTRNKTSVLRHLKESENGFEHVASETEEIKVDTDAPSGHQVVTAKFIDRILHQKGDLIAEGTEGIQSVTLANGIMLSSFTGRTVEVPIDADRFEQELRERIRTSSFVKPEAAPRSTSSDISQSFSK